LDQIGIASNMQNYSQTVEATLDALADHLDQHCDIDQIIELAS